MWKEGVFWKCNYLEGGSIFFLWSEVWGGVSYFRSVPDRDDEPRPRPLQVRNEKSPNKMFQTPHHIVTKTLFMRIEPRVNIWGFATDRSTAAVLILFNFGMARCICTFMPSLIPAWYIVFMLVYFSIVITSLRKDRELVTSQFRYFVTFIIKLCHHMSRDMTKPTKWLCVQRRLRSVWATASVVVMLITHLFGN